MKSKKWLFKLLGEMIEFAEAGDRREFYQLNGIYEALARRGGYSEVLTKVDILYETCKMHCFLSLNEKENSESRRTSWGKAKNLYAEIAKNFPRR